MSGSDTDDNIEDEVEGNSNEDVLAVSNAASGDAHGPQSAPQTVVMTGSTNVRVGHSQTHNYHQTINYQLPSPREDTGGYIPSKNKHEALLPIVQDILRRCYIEQLSNLKPIPWARYFDMEMEHMFTNLEIIEGFKHRLDKRRATSLAASECDDINSHSGHTSISSPSVLRTVEDLADKLWRNQGRTVTFIEGPPGIGKSTLCRRLAYIWAKENFQTHRYKFKMVILLEARVMKCDFKESLFQQLFPEDVGNEVNKDNVYECMQASKGECLVIVDGLDEVNDSAKPSLIKLLKGKLLSEANVLVTGRPEVSQEYTEYCHNHLRITGFSEENRNYYIHRYFSSDQLETRDAVLRQINKYRHLQILTVNPFTVLLICILAENGGGEIPTNQYDILKQITELICRRYITTCEDSNRAEPPPSEADILSAARNLAFAGIESNKLAFDESFVRERFPHDLSEHLLKSGLLIRDVTVSRIHARGYCYFPHKTIQEYLCAEFLANCPEEEFISRWNSVRGLSRGIIHICLLQVLVHRHGQFNIVLTDIVERWPYIFEANVKELTNSKSLDLLAEYFIKQCVLTHISIEFWDAWVEFCQNPNFFRVALEKMKLPPVLLYMYSPFHYHSVLEIDQEISSGWWDYGTLFNDINTLEMIATALPIINCPDTKSAVALLINDVDVRVLTILQRIIYLRDYQVVSEFIRLLEKEDKPITVYLELFCDCELDYMLMRLLESISCTSCKNTRLHVHVNYWLSNPYKCEVRVPYKDEFHPASKYFIRKCAEDADNIYDLPPREYRMKRLIHVPPHRMYFERHCPY